MSQSDFHPQPPTDDDQEQVHVPPTPPWKKMRGALALTNDDAPPDAMQQSTIEAGETIADDTQDVWGTECSGVDGQAHDDAQEAPQEQTGETETYDWSMISSFPEVSERDDALEILTQAKQASPLIPEFQLCEIVELMLRLQKQIILTGHLLPNNVTMIKAYISTLLNHIEIKG